MGIINHFPRDDEITLPTIPLLEGNRPLIEILFSPLTTLDDNWG